MSDNLKPCTKCIEFYQTGADSEFNCSEATLFGLADYLNISSELIPSLATPFGRGVARNGYMCGSLVGGLIAIGLKYGRKRMDGDKNPSYSRADRLISKFVSKFGTVNCSEITGMKMKDLVNDEEEMLRIHHNICKPLVRQVCKWTIEELDSEDL